MIKLAGLFWFVLVSTAGFAMFAVKYEVQSLEDELNQVRKAAAAEQHAIHMDEVEWAYLTRPETLEEMGRRHLSLTPIATIQLRTALPDIPLRPPPSPPVEEVVAAAESPTMPARSDAASSPDTTQPATPAIAPPAETSLVTAAPLTTAQALPPVAASRIATRAPEIAKAVIKVAAKPAGAHRPKTLDDLIAQIVASR